MDAERLTEQLRAGIGEARRAAVVLAQRVRGAHRARVWVALGHSGWGEYAQVELGISRAQAYRLIDIAETSEGLSRAIGAAGVLTEVSPAGDTDTAALVDLGLSQRALREVHGRLDELTTLVTERLTAAAQAGQVQWPAVRAIVGQAVDELRREPLPTGADDTRGSDGGGALERALTYTQRHPADTSAVRRLVDEMVAACLAATTPRAVRPARRAASDTRPLRVGGPSFALSSRVGARVR
ncbi:hypothetical protein [Streptomyces chryseus]|uniref:DUF222 domain-containing protein n=1 Tax=Streptomyces chryseus TaxID=68186 RepID=A0ABQ3E6D7_9ACTN|nr:hypothetical protein [Streptomyces chryseus]GHB26493.1 hypothetical protein GCM10010346_57600 [Streptomyces chryseus]